MTLGCLVRQEEECEIRHTWLTHLNITSLCVKLSMPGTQESFSFLGAALVESEETQPFFEMTFCRDGSFQAVGTIKYVIKSKGA